MYVMGVFRRTGKLKLDCALSDGNRRFGLFLDRNLSQSLGFGDFVRTRLQLLRQSNNYISRVQNYLKAFRFCSDRRRAFRGHSQWSLAARLVFVHSHGVVFLPKPEMVTHSHNYRCVVAVL